jgi:3',5'-cyclic AMP phosphodiesterase CpdA
MPSKATLPRPSYDPARRKFLRNTAVASGGVAATTVVTGCGGSSPDDLASIELGPPVSGNFYPPRGIHVSVLDDSVTTRGLCWFTDSLENPVSYVQWGPLDDVLSDAEIQDVITYPLDYVTEGSAEKTTALDNITHKVTLTDVPSNRGIRYRVGSETGGWSDVAMINPTPASGDTWKFITYGDMGFSHRAQRLAAETQKPQHAHDLLLIAGDVAYADGIHERWDVWFDTFEPYLKSQVMMTVPGNHENKDKDVDDDDYTTIPTYAFTNRFHHPGAINYYGLDYNRVYFYAFTAGAFLEDSTLAQEMADLEAGLADASARRAAGEIDFIVVFQHYTIWTDQAGRAPGNGSLIAAEEEILTRYGVDLLLCGHDHVYQRSAKMYKGQRNPAGYIQLMTGTGGASIRLFEPTIQDWSEKEFIGIGFSAIEVDNDRMTVRFYGSGPAEMETRDQIVHADLADDFPLVDEFVVQRRTTPVAKQYIKEPRSRQQLLAAYDWEKMEREIRFRNAMPHFHG